MIDVLENGPDLPRVTPVGDRGVGHDLPPAATELVASLGDRGDRGDRAPVISVIGPGGTGKSVVMELARLAFLDAGTPVARSVDEDPRPGTALVIDDVHRLDPGALARLVAVASRRVNPLVVARRPWPRPDGLAALSADVADGHRVVVLGHLDRPAVARRMSRRLAVAEAPTGMVELVHEQSGGLPVLVDVITTALRDSGRYDPTTPDRFRRPDRVTVSVAMAERLRYQVDALTSDVRALLEAMSVGAPLRDDVLEAMLDSSGPALSATVESARATGLLTEAGELIPFIRSLFLRLTPLLRSRDQQRTLAGIELAGGGSVLAAGRRLLGTGAGGPQVASVFVAAAEEAFVQSPQLAGELLTAAVEAGTPAVDLAGPRAQAAALAGDLDAALRLADLVVSDRGAPGWEAGVRAAATVLSHRGLALRGAELHRGLPPGSAVLAVPSLVATGQVDAARSVLVAADTVSNGTLVTEATTLMARGMLATVTGDGPTGLSLLARATGLLAPVASTVLLPDGPAALTAIVALQCGELSLAESALVAATAAGHGGPGARSRHRLLLGWVHLRRGRLDQARTILDDVAREQPRLEPREELVAATLAVALARRAGDVGAAGAALARAHDALLCQPVDLTTLAALGELAVAGALLDDKDWLAAHLADAQTLLDQVGRPALWAAPLHWYLLQAALARPDELDPDVVAAALGHLEEHTGGGPHFAVLAQAGRLWSAAANGELTAPGPVIATVARRLHANGLAWEAAQLAGRAAPLAGDRRATAALHALARTMVVSADEPADPTRPAAAADQEPDEPTGHTPVGHTPVGHTPVGRTPVGRSEPAPRAVFTERELEIGEHILAGLTYKQIGQRLYISAKTVEHHVARMRQRLGVASRDELFGLLRSALPNDPASP